MARRDTKPRKLIEAREQAARTEGERDVFQDALQAAKAIAEEAGQRAGIAEERTAAHQRTVEIVAVMGRVAEGLEHIRQTQAKVEEVVFPQMTKPDVLTLGAGREHVADLDLGIGHDHPVDQELDEGAARREGRLGQAARDPLPEDLQRRRDRGQVLLLLGLAA